MGKKLLVILGVAAVAGYIFRDRLLAAAVDLMERANGLFVDDDSDDLFLEEDVNVN